MGVQVPQFLAGYFGFHSNMQGYTLLIIAGFVLLFASTATLALNKLNFQRR